MKQSLALALLLFASAVSADQPVLNLPAKVTAKPGRICRIQVDAQKAANVQWWCDDDNVDLFREYDPATISLCFVSDVAGSYKVHAIASGSAGELSKPVTCLVTVGDSPPVPPPVPPPIPPSPDSLVQSVQAAYTAETDAGKASKKDLLQSLYSLAGTVTVNDPSIKTLGDFFTKILTARRTLVSDTEMVQTRKAVDAYLGSKLPSNAAQALDQATKDLVGSEFKKVADALGKVK